MCKLVSFKTNTGEMIKVADVKFSCIQNMVLEASKCKCISEIILFGSSLEESCTENSDIDIAIISKYTVDYLSGNKSFSKFMEAVYSYDYAQEYDRLYFASIEQIEKNMYHIPICTELAKKGKTIYQKKE